MARGAKAKEEIITKILEVFQGSFKNDKEIRIPVKEDGETVQIKVTLTAAKTNVSPDGEDKTSDEAVIKNLSQAEILEPTKEEKRTVEELIKKLF